MFITHQLLLQLSSAQAQHALAPGMEESKHSNSFQPVFDVDGILGQLLFFLHPDSDVKSSSTQHQAPRRIEGFLSTLQVKYDFELVLHPETA